MKNTFTSENEPKHVYTWYSYGENPYGEISVRRKFFTAKILYGENFVRRKLLTAKFPYGENAGRRKLRIAKNPTAKISAAKNPTAKIPVEYHGRIQTLQNATMSTKEQRGRT